MSPKDQLLTAPYLLETNRSDSPALLHLRGPRPGQPISLATSARRAAIQPLAEVKHRLDEDDKRQETDHGHAHRGDGFEVGPFLAVPGQPRASEPRRPVAPDCSGPVPPIAAAVAMMMKMLMMLLQ